MSAERFGVYRKASAVDFDLTTLAQIPLPTRVLFVRPTHFEVAYVINPHMAAHLGTVEPQAASEQWRLVVDVYRGFGLDVAILEGVAGLPDMVFCANQSLPALGVDASKQVVASKMASVERGPEVGHFERFFESQGYRVHEPPPADFEGMGDALWHGECRLLWVGTGFRTESRALDYLAETLEAPVIELGLVDPLLYHLDTCLSFLDSTTALWVPSAFNKIGQELIRSLVSNLVEVPLEEATASLACNAHCVDGHNIVIQAGCPTTAKRVRDLGFNVIEVETGEFLKSGGSVFCMKQMYW